MAFRLYMSVLMSILINPQLYVFSSTNKSANTGLKYRPLNDSYIKAQIMIRMMIIAINDPEEMPASVIVRVAGLSDCLLTLILPETQTR